MKINIKNNKRILGGVILTTVILGTAGTALAYGGGQGNGQGGGCMGDLVCMEERKAQKEAGNETYSMTGGQGGKNSGDHSMVELELIKNSPLLPLSETDKETLTLMREEEKLAGDVYTALYKKWGEKIFDNISKSEEKHKEAIKVLLEKYNLEDPILNDSPGVFVNENLAKLYSDLIEKGSKTLIDALEVGMIIEDLDIYDLEKAMAETNNEDILNVYTKLRNASENHMRAFSKNLKAQDPAKVYEVQYLSQERYQEILNGQNRNKANHQNSGGQNGGGVNYNPTLDSTAVADNTYQAQEESFFAKVWRWMFGWL